MKLDNQQKALLKHDFKESYNIFETYITDNDIDKYLDKDFQGSELVIMMMLLSKKGLL